MISFFAQQQHGKMNQRDGSSSSDEHESLLTHNQNRGGFGEMLRDSNKFGYGQAIDFELLSNEDEILKRYDAMYWLLTERGRYPSTIFMRYILPGNNCNPFPKGRRLKREECLELGCLDWCVAHALNGDSGSNYIGEIQQQLNYVILQAALLLTITGPEFISPPSFASSYMTHTFSGIMGFSAFLYLTTIILATTMSNYINKPYVPSLTMLARIEANNYIKLMSLMLYTASTAFVVAFLLVAYERSPIDFYAQLYVIAIIIFLACVIYQNVVAGLELQRESVWQFYERFCDADGRLMQKYLDSIYETEAPEKSNTGSISASSVLRGGIDTNDKPKAK